MVSLEAQSKRCGCVAPVNNVQQKKFVWTGLIGGCVLTFVSFVVWVLRNPDSLSDSLNSSIYMIQYTSTPST